MSILQINHTGFAPDGKPLFEVMRMLDGNRCPAVELTPPGEVMVATHNITLKQGLRWYLEEYLSLPVDVEHIRADNVQDTLKAWGRDCFNTLFTGDAQNWYYNAHQIGLTNLTIKVASDDPAVLAYPWEALYSDDDEFIAQQCRIERQLTSVADGCPFTTELPQNQLNILYIIARPYGERDVGFQTLARPLVDFVDDGKWAVQIDLLRPPTFEKLREVLREKPNFYHIVHFDGHGGAPVSETEEYEAQAGVLVFEKEDDPENEGNPISANEISALLQEHNIPYVVLNACQSAMIDEIGDDPFASVAASLLKAGVRSVVAMGYNLWVSGAEVFVSAFYKRLFEEGDMAEAMRVGRQEMYDKNMRNTFIGETEFNDWIVPVLYKQTTSEHILPNLTQGATERGSVLPTEAQLLRSDFIGRSEDIQKLERAMQRQPQAGILIHGMAGEGKTTLTQGFLQWLASTGGLIAAEVFWFSFDSIHSASYVIDTITDKLFGTEARTLLLETKLPMIVETLRTTPMIMVWDNFESASGYGDVKGLLFDDKRDDRKVLKDLLRDLHGGATKVLITSRSSESWLNTYESVRLKLEGLQGEELWQYCNAVIRGLGLTIDRDISKYKPLIDKLQGNPLAIRVILMHLEKQPAEALLDEFNQGTLSQNWSNDPDTEQLLKTLSIFNGGLNKAFAPILRLVGLHERFVVANYITGMLNEIGESADKVEECFDTLEKAGLCHKVFEVVESGYRIHPILRISLSIHHSAGTTEQRVFVRFIGLVCDIYKRKQLQEQIPVFELFDINFRNALKIAQKMDMQDQVGRLLSGLGMYAYLKSRNFAEAVKLLEQYVQESGKPLARASAYHQLAIIMFEQGDFDAAEKLFKQALEIAPEESDRIGTAQTYCELGNISRARRDFDTATKWYKQALELLPKYSEDHNAVIIYYNFGMVAQDQHDFDTAVKWFEQVLYISTQRQDYKQSAANASHQLGMIAEQRGDFATANKRYKYAAEIRRNIGDEYEEAKSYFQLGRVEVQCKDYDTAEKWYKRVLNIMLSLNQVNDNENIIGIDRGSIYRISDIVALTYGELGLIATLRNRDYETAEKWYKQALDILGDQYNALYIYYRLGMSAYEQHNLNTAAEWLNHALRVSLKFDGEGEISALHIYNLLAMVAQEQGNLVDAEKRYKHILAINLELRDKHETALTYFKLCMITIEMQNFVAAEDYIKAYLKILRANTTYYGVDTVKSAEEILRNIQIARNENCTWISKIIKRFFNH